MFLKTAAPSHLNLFIVINTGSSDDFRAAAAGHLGTLQPILSMVWVSREGWAGLLGATCGTGAADLLALDTNTLASLTQSILPGFVYLFEEYRQVDSLTNWRITNHTRLSD